MRGAIFKVVLSLCLLALVFTCGTDPAADDPMTTDATDPTTVASSSGGKVFFP
jgi:hypothetical protein